MAMLTKKDLCLQIDVFLKLFFCWNLKSWLSFFANMKVLVFSVLIFLHKILSLELKIKTFSKSTFTGLLKNVLNFNHTWLWCQVMVVQKCCKFYYSESVLVLCQLSKDLHLDPDRSDITCSFSYYFSSDKLSLWFEVNTSLVQ